jgi:5'(3')-deoxyribonucleotidase
MKPVVLLDCDGVLADFITPCLRVIERLTGNRHAHDDVDVWDFDRKLIASDTDREAYWACITAPGFCASLEPYSGTPFAVECLRSVADVYILTSPMLAPTWAHERQQWLKEHFGVSHKHIISTPAKRLVAGDVFVDDKPEHVEAWSQRWTSGIGICWAAPYNATHADAFMDNRTRDWNTVLRVARQAAERSST